MKTVVVASNNAHKAEEIAAALPACAYLATDASESMVAATAARGLHAEVATIGSLPYPDASFDVVVAAWMLYHVPDLDAALAEVRRVLRPGGSFVAVTNGDRHLARLLEEDMLGDEPLEQVRAHAEASGLTGCEHRALRRGKLEKCGVKDRHAGYRAGTREAQARVVRPGVDDHAPCGWPRR